MKENRSLDWRALPPFREDLIGTPTWLREVTLCVSTSSPTLLSEWLIMRVACQCMNVPGCELRMLALTVCTVCSLVSCREESGYTS